VLDQLAASLVAAIADDARAAIARRS